MPAGVQRENGFPRIGGERRILHQPYELCPIPAFVGAAAASLLVLPDGLGIPSQTKAPGAIVDLLLVLTLATRRIRRITAGRSS